MYLFPSKRFLDEICKVWKWNPQTKTEKTRMGALVKDLLLKQAKPEEIKQRVYAMKAEWGKKCCTPEAIVKHWDLFKPETSKIETYVPEEIKPEDMPTPEERRAFKEKMDKIFKMGEIK